MLIERAEILNNLDELPFPDWDQMKPSDFPPTPQGVFFKKSPIGIISSSRGCAHNCSFCASVKFFGRKVRFRSPENVVEEILLLKEKYNVKEIQFQDDNLIMKRSHIEKICNLMIEKKINLPWSCPNGIRADCVDDGLIKLMKKAGLYYCGLGIESANDAILKNINKSESVDTIRNAIEIIAKNGVECGGFFIFGLPGETKETMQNSINFAVNTPLSRANFYILAVLPGCDLWNELEGKYTTSFSQELGREIEYIPEGLTEKDLKKANSVAYKKFYLRTKIVIKNLKYFRFGQVKYLLKRAMFQGLVSKHQENNNDK
jgi:radical SAM superfamily enzyme YgiQ (UPF0313 family)